MKVALFGKIELDSYTGELTVLHPEFEILNDDDADGEAALHVGRVVPIYEAIQKITDLRIQELRQRNEQFLHPLNATEMKQLEDDFRNKKIEPIALFSNVVAA